MKYARIINNVAVDVTHVPPGWVHTPELAAQFVVVPDIENGSVRLAGLVNEKPTGPLEWHPPRSRLEEYQAGKWRVTQDAQAEQVVFSQAAPTRFITKLAFRQRFDQNEKIAIELAAIDDPTALLSHRQQAAAIRANMDDQRDAKFIDLDMPATRIGVMALEQAGLLSSGRALQILDAPIQPHEVFEE